MEEEIIRNFIDNYRLLIGIVFIIIMEIIFYLIYMTTDEDCFPFENTLGNVIFSKFLAFLATSCIFMIFTIIIIVINMIILKVIIGIVVLILLNYAIIKILGARKK